MHIFLDLRMDIKGILKAIFNIVYRKLTVFRNRIHTCCKSKRIYGKFIV